MNYIVYTEILEPTVQRYYYGAYATADQANAVAMSLGNEYPTFHCVCERTDEMCETIQGL